MGTSGSLPSGKGGQWSDLKGQITGHFTGSRTVSLRGIVRDAVRASGGIGVGGRGGGAGRRSGGGGGAGGGAAAVGPVVGGLGGFGTAVRDRGLADGLESLGLGELEGRSAVEVVAAVSEHLTATVEGLDGELMAGALRESIIEAAALGDQDGFADLERGLQGFLDQNGVEGLVEIFLSKFVFDAVWANIEAYVQEKSPDQDSMDAFTRAVEGICDSEVRGTMDDARERGELDSLDWFGEDGQRIGRGIFASVERRLRGMG